jgi:hypothetical protein
MVIDAQNTTLDADNESDNNNNKINATKGDISDQSHNLSYYDEEMS